MTGDERSRKIWLRRRWELSSCNETVYKGKTRVTEKSEIGIHFAGGTGNSFVCTRKFPPIAKRLAGTGKLKAARIPSFPGTKWSTAWSMDLIIRESNAYETTDRSMKVKRLKLKLRTPTKTTLTLFVSNAWNYILLWHLPQDAKTFIIPVFPQEALIWW